MSRNFELLRKAQPASDFLEPIRADLGRPLPPAARRRPAHAPHETSDWLRGLNVLRKHWRLSAIFAAVVTVSVAVFTLLLAPVYEPEARLEVDPPGAEVFSLQGNNGGAAGADYLETQSKNLQSDELALDVIRKMHLDQNREFAGAAAASAPAPASASGNVLQLSPAENNALATLKSSRKVNRDSGSRLITVKVAAHDPVLAADITNTTVSLFIDREYKLRGDAIAQSSQWLQRQLDDIKQRMEQSNQALANFQRESGIAAIGDNQNTFSEQMMELSKQLMQAQADRIQLQSYLNKFSGQPASSLPQISSNPVVQALTQKLAEARAELSQTLAIYGKNHPNAKKLQNQVDELQTQLDAQRQAILNDLKTSYTAAQAREHLMQSQVQGAGKQMTLLSQYNALKKEADANSQLYNSLFQKIKEAGITAESKSSNIRVVDRARVLAHPTRPHRTTNMALGLLAGLVGGVLLAFLRESLDTRVHTPEDVKRCLGADSVSVVPVIGEGEASGAGLLPRRSRAGVSQIFLLDRPHSPEAEALRGLYTSVRLGHGGVAPRVILVVSPLPGEGKTTLSVNLATALAQHGTTCIVDADMRKEGVAPAFRITARHGLSEVLTGSMELDEVLLAAPRLPNLAILPIGSAVAEPGKLIASTAMTDLMRTLRERFEFVVIDSPPILPFADGRALSAVVDGVVLVGRAGVTTRASLVRAMELLHEIHSAPVMDIVLNAADYPAVDYRHYRYGYGSA